LQQAFFAFLKFGVPTVESKKKAMERWHCKCSQYRKLFIKQWRHLTRAAADFFCRRFFGGHFLEKFLEFSRQWQIFE
jgi:hypothetical protein